MSDNEEEETIEIQIEDVDSELERIDYDIHNNNRIENKIMGRLTGQLETNNRLLESPNKYPNIRRYLYGIALILFIILVFKFLDLTQNRDHDLY